MFSLHVNGITVALLLLFAFSRPTLAKERIFVDQWSPTQSRLIVADTNGQNPRKLIPGSERDYNASFSPNGEWVVFTSERRGSADIFRVHPDGTGLEQLTSHPSYDDQAALSPDGQFLAFVSTRDAGSTDIYVLDLRTGETKNITRAQGGDFRPQWSPDGRLIAFSSDRGKPPQMAQGRWEQVHEASVYIMKANGEELRQLTTDGQLGGSPKWSPNGQDVIFYEVAVEDTFRARWLPDQSSVESRIVSINLRTGARHEHASGPGLKLSPQFLGPNRVGYLAKSGPTATLVFDNEMTSLAGDIGNPAWSPDGRFVVFQQGVIATIAQPRAPGQRLQGRDPDYELLYASGFPAVSPDGERLVVSERTGRGQSDDRTALAIWHTDGTNPARVYRGSGSVMSPQWSADGKWIVFGVGHYFLNRTQPAQLMMIQPDGTNARTLTTGPGNSGFPSFSPDGTQVVYRFWSDTAGGLRIVNLADNTVKTLTTDYDNFPMWSPQGNQIVFSRLAADNNDFDIFSISPTGTNLERLTTSQGNDSHPAWSTNGEAILFSSSRFGFKDEAPLSDIPQPYGELFIMKPDGSEQRPLTDNRWEEGTPAWLPEPKN